MDVASQMQEQTPTVLTKGKLVRSQKFEWRNLKTKLADLREQKEKLSRKDPLFKKKKREIAREMKQLVAEMRNRQALDVEEFDAAQHQVRSLFTCINFLINRVVRYLNGLRGFFCEQQEHSQAEEIEKRTSIT
jgi:hypothetical protein